MLFWTLPEMGGGNKLFVRFINVVGRWTKEKKTKLFNLKIHEFIMVAGGKI